MQANEKALGQHGTYDWRPCKMLCEKHVLLLLCVRHLVVYFGVAVWECCEVNLRCCDAPRSCLLATGILLDSC
jgi:hypothetical protein